MTIENKWKYIPKPKADQTIVALTAQLTENRNLLSKATSELAKDHKHFQSTKPQATRPVTKFSKKQVILVFISRLVVSMSGVPLDMVLVLIYLMVMIIRLDKAERGEEQEMGRGQETQG